MSGVTCKVSSVRFYLQVSCVMCYVSCVMCHMSLYLINWFSYLMEGLLSTGPTRSSFSFSVRYGGGGVDGG